MKGDYGKPTSLSEHLKRPVKPPFKCSQLIVNGYAKCLKGFSCGMTVTPDFLRNRLGQTQ